MYKVNVNFASGRNLEIDAKDLQWGNNTLAIIKKENEKITVNVSYHTVETIEIEVFTNQ